MYVMNNIYLFLGKMYNYSLLMANVTGEFGLHLVRQMTLAV